MMSSFTGACYDHYSSLHFALLVLQGRALASCTLPVRQARHELKPVLRGSGLYRVAFLLSTSFAWMHGRYRVAVGTRWLLGEWWLSAFSSFPAMAGSKILGISISAAVTINLIQTNIVALYRPGKVMFQTIRATRVQKVAVFNTWFCVVGLSFAYKAWPGALITTLGFLTRSFDWRFQ